MVTVRTFRGGKLISRARVLIASLLLALPVILLVVPSLLLGASGEKVVLLSEGGRRELATTVRGAAELLPIAQVVTGMGVTLAPDPRGLSLTLTAQCREVVLYAEPWVQPMAHPIVVLATREGKGTEHAAKTVLLKVER